MFKKNEMRIVTICAFHLQFADYASFNYMHVACLIVCFRIPQTVSDSANTEEGSINLFFRINSERYGVVSIL